MPFNKSAKGSKSITVEKEGYLSVKCCASVSKSKEKSWQQKYIVLRKSFGDGTCLERYENFEAFIAHKNPTKLRLDGIDYIGPVDLSENTYAFIMFGDGQSQLQMAARSEAERSEWIKALNHCLENGRKSVHPISPPTPQEGYAVKLKDYDCTANKDILRDGNRDYIMIVGLRDIALINVRGERKKLVLSWLLENIKSYESRPLEQNPSQKLLTIYTGRSSVTGQGTFDFFTLHGDLIKKQISQNVKRTYFKKKASQESFNPESPDSAKSMSTSPRFGGSPIGSPRRSVSSKEGPIPFHKYDPPTSSDRTSYAPYIQQPNGYVDIFTDPRKVEEDRNRRHGSRSSISTCPQLSPLADDHSTSQHVSSPERYVKVLAGREADPGSGYLDVLADGAPDLGNYLEVLNEEERSQYIEVLNEEERHHQYVEVLADEKSTSVSEDHPSYVELLPDTEVTHRPCGISRESSEDVEIYIDVEQNRKKFEYEMHLESHERFESHDEHVETSFESHEQHMETRYKLSETNHTSCTSTREVCTSTREVHVTSNGMSRDIQHETKESSASVYSPRWPASVTSQTSTGSSDNDVFQDMMSIVPEVFAEETMKSNDVPTISEVVAKNSDDGSNNIRVESDNFASKDDFTSKELLSKPVPLPRKSALTSSKSATLPTKSEGLSTNSDVKSSDVNETRNDLTPTPGSDRNNRHSKAKSWHSENGNELVYTSANSTSTSESDNTPRDFSEDENSDHAEDSPSFGESRDRSHTAGELYSLRTNTRMDSTSILQALEMQLTNPQQYTPNKHPPLTREPRCFTPEQLIAQLENPILGVSSLPNANLKKNEIKFKYICLNCGWHKKSKKRTSLKPSLRSKQCPQCNNPVTKQDKNKDKSSGGFISKIIRSRRSSDEKLDKKIDVMKPERPSAVPAEPMFLKRVRDPGAFVLGRHSPSFDPIRSERGIAPSPLQALSAISIDGGSINNDESTSSLGKPPLSASLSDGGLTSPTSTVSPTAQLSKGLTPTAAGNYSLRRTESSPPLSGAGESAPEMLDVHDLELKVSRKNSGLLPTLPEVEDVPAQSNHQGPHTLPPGTPPPVIPPRTRELPPPLPPRRGSSPVVPREDLGVRLRRTQTDPNSTIPMMPAPPFYPNCPVPTMSTTPNYPNSTVSVMSLQPSYPKSTVSAVLSQPSSPQVKQKSRISRTMTDPGNNFTTSNESIRNAVSLSSLLDDANEELQIMKIFSLSLGDGLETDSPPPPLPPRRGSGQTHSPAVTPFRAPSNENERLVNGCDSPRLEPRTAPEGRRPLPAERTHSASVGSPKLPLSAKRSVDAKRDFQNRKPLYSAHVSE